MTALMNSDEAFEALRRGGVVAVPTDTVYGVAASIRQPEAVHALFALKRRPATQALPVLVGADEQINELGIVWPEGARRLADAFWPGALTIVVDAPRSLSELVGSTEETVGIRRPDDALLAELLERCGPLVVTSANEHGAPPCTNPAEVIETFAGLEELSGVLDGGERAGVVSSVVRLSATSWSLVRCGAISEQQIESVLAR